MNITREVALTELYLDHQAQLYGITFPRVSARVWAAELAKATVWFVGLVLLLFGMALLAPESRGDTLSTGQVASYLDANSVLPLAAGVDTQLATNLLVAQQQTWGKQWQEGSLQASMDAVLRAITLYVWPGGPAEITSKRDNPIVWAQSKVAIDLGLSGGFDTAVVNFGEVQVVSTPEPRALVLMGLVLLVMIGFSIGLASRREAVR